MTDSSQATSLGTAHGRLLRGGIVALALLGLCLSLYLTWTTWNSSSVAGCGGDGLVDCEHVLASRWSKWLGLPVSLLGTLVYLGILVSGALTTRSRPGLAMTVLLSLALIAAGSAAWFVGLQVLILKGFCLYCMGVHACSFVICALSVLLWRGQRPRRDEGQMQALFGVTPVSETLASGWHADGGGSRLLLCVGVASLGIVALLVGQFFFPPPPSGLVMETVADASPSGTVEQLVQAVETDKPPVVVVDQQQPRETESVKTARSPADRPRFIKFNGLKTAIDVTKLPIMGSPQAAHVIVEMLDYTCPQCRMLHKHVHAARERYGMQLAFVVFHVPLGKKCNPYIKKEHPSHRDACDYARLALSIWKLNREKFAEYHEWLMEEEKPPSLFNAKRRAIQLVGTKVLLDESLQADSFRNIAGNIEDMNKLQSGLPIFLTERGVVRGAPTSEGDWFEFLEKHLNMVPETSALE